ncbi:MAG: polyribonucleotide nucleotidyltransferase [Bdellovibrionales bacterium]|nr:polyribonucleotide nucleotidyltransferase [Bdellovibrionales bacterium]
METVEINFHGNTISMETGRVARQAGGSILIKSADSLVLVTACVGDEKDANFLPLTIDYVEKAYAGGKIPGGFFKREGRLGEKETLTSRFIDRPIRPLFPKGFRHELQVSATVLSADPTVDTDILALCGASAALSISEAPFEGPIAGVRVIRKNGKLMINPTMDDANSAELNFIVAGSKDAIVMVEGGAQEVPEAEVLDALYYAHQELQHIIKMQEDLQAKVGKPKIEFTPAELSAEVKAKILELGKDKILEAVQITSKSERSETTKAVRNEIISQIVSEEDPEADKKTEEAKEIFEKVHSELVRNFVLTQQKRIDGRDYKTVRDISIELNLLPRAHGSSLFTRGETQAIVVTTLGTEEEGQRIDALVGDSSNKNFMLHYNFPPFSVGEVRPLRGPGRREIGHGALAERALRAILPSSAEFPYVIRIVSEITESNGSSSMASVCGGSLSLMAAGVPIKAPVAGIAMGLIAEGDKHAVLTDILGDEDHLGDMDFKVTGTKGITALQMDIKIKGLKNEVMSAALEQAKDARLHILGIMTKVINAPAELSDYAPKIITLKINPDKIRDIIGPGGKTIRSITESCGVKIDISDDGTVNVSGTAGTGIKSALDIIQSLTAEAEVGKIYKGVVKRIADYGAFVEILPGTDGLVHISQLSNDRVRSVSDFVSEGDELLVKVLGIDRQGKIRLSHKEALEDGESEAAAS